MREAERAFERLMRLLGESIICQRCGATLFWFSVVCTAGVGERCPGRERIEQALDEEEP